MHISEYLKRNRGQTKRLAARLGVSASLVIQWGNGKPVALERCPQIEQATEGVVTCEELTGAVAWDRKSAPDWPWHPQGRPLIDVTRQPAADDQQEARDAA